MEIWVETPCTVILHLHFDVEYGNWPCGIPGIQKALDVGRDLALVLTYR